MISSYFFLLIIQSFSHFIGNFNFTDCPDFPGFTVCMLSSVSEFHNCSILNSKFYIVPGINISSVSPTLNLFLISIIDFSSLYSITFPPNSYSKLYCFPSYS